MKSGPFWHLALGDSSDMAGIQTGSVQAIITSPPYYPPEADGLFARPKKQQADYDRVRQMALDHVPSLDPVYKEMSRILSLGRIMVLQVRDLRYAGRVIPITALHGALAEKHGFQLLGRFLWYAFHRRSRGGLFRRHPGRGPFVPDDPEEILVFSKGNPTRFTPVGDLPPKELEAASSPVWWMPAMGRMREHPFQASPAVIRRLIRLYAAPDECIMDPFAGVGTSLRCAYECGRNAIGYEIVPEMHTRAIQSLERHGVPVIPHFP
jgi:DNA modification methylase